MENYFLKIDTEIDQLFFINEEKLAIHDKELEFIETQNKQMISQVQEF